MRAALLALILLVPIEAFAAPCEVTIARAPDDVRDAIEGWVAAEPSCATTAEVRVVPTDGGYYLIAIDGDGRVHERTVPDAQSAGVLVASWIADDGSRPSAPDVATVAAPPPPPVRVAAAVAPPRDAPVIATAAPPREPRYAIAFGPTIDLSPAELPGVRAELDLWRRGRWGAGTVLTYASTVLRSDQQDYTFDRGTIVANGTYTRRSRKWSLRLSAGLGPVLAHSKWWYLPMEEITSISWHAEASVQVARSLGRSWAVSGGPILQSLLVDDPGEPNLSAYLGVRYGF